LGRKWDKVCAPQEWGRKEDMINNKRRNSKTGMKSLGTMAGRARGTKRGSS